MGGAGFWPLVEGHWRRGSCVIIDASQPHLALGLGIHRASGIPRGAYYLHIHVRTPDVSILSTVHLRRVQKRNCWYVVEVVVEEKWIDG